MAKKNFSSGLDNLLGESQLEKSAGKLTKDKKEQVLDQARASFMLKLVTLEEVKAIAFFERRKIQEVVQEALSKYASDYQKKYGDEFKKVYESR